MPFIVKGNKIVSHTNYKTANTMRNYHLEHGRRIKYTSAIGYCYDCGEESKMYFRCEKCRSKVNRKRGMSGRVNTRLHTPPKERHHD